MVDVTTLAQKLIEQGKDASRGFPFEVTPIPGDVEVLQITIEDKQELPIFVSVSEEQILCIAYLFKTDEVKPDNINDINRVMLSANISIPLSAFGLVGDQYVIYGALSTQSSMEDIVHELEALSSNTIEAIEVMSDYLN